ncbi:hypothetical protein FB45DRAFT_743190 [Roridomyces roridus]|uniref:Uncharacterized protein n=1 Tax=Roridomyces roridus TaxID=1738132 RepID=A0AAD7BZY0_9AGAR|nr:hypothetical protein FB45DRAFT_743190 [Roridomyces roridus]
MDRLSKLWPSRAVTGGNYELLPTSQDQSSNDDIRSHASSFSRRKRLCARPLSPKWLATGFVVVLILGGLYVYSGRSADVDDPLPTTPEPLPADAPVEQQPDVIPDTPTPPRPPPLYEEYNERERLLPQHNIFAASPDGSHAKFLWFANHGSHFGWGNYMQEMLLNAYLAYSAQRSYVFDNYTWEREGPDIADWNGKPIPARIPLSVFLSGAAYSRRAHARPDVPRSVSRQYSLEICPQDRKFVVDTRKIQEKLHQNPTASEIVEKWVEELKRIDEPCVEIHQGSPALFDYEITNTDRVLDIFPSLSKSPILANFGWSPLILEAFNDNLEYFVSPSDLDAPPSTTTTSLTPLKGLLALHVRRGDYETWCENTYNNGMSYTGFNSFTELPDKYTPSHRPGSKTTMEDSMRHCLPSIEQIVKRVMDVAGEGTTTTRVYVLTNGSRPWLAELKAALEAARKWPGGVATSRDLELSWEAKFVAEAVDMYVASRAERFIGNGFSSLTSNIVLLRMHNPDLDPTNTRFW